MCPRHHVTSVKSLCRLLANGEQEEDTEDEIDEIFAKYKESLKGRVAITIAVCLSISR